MFAAIPPDLSAPGARLWNSITADFDIDEHERAVLVEACRTVDALELLDGAVVRDGPLVPSTHGVNAHPALVEARQQRIALARLLAALRLPAGEAEDRQQNARQQRRAVRGFYGIRGGAAS